MATFSLFSLPPTRPCPLLPRTSLVYYYFKSTRKQHKGNTHSGDNWGEGTYVRGIVKRRSNGVTWMVKGRCRDYPSGENVFVPTTRSEFRRSLDDPHDPSRFDSSARVALPHFRSPASAGGVTTRGIRQNRSLCGTRPHERSTTSEISLRARRRERERENLSRFSPVGVAAGANKTEPIAEEGWSSRCLSSRPSAGDDAESRRRA